MMCKLGRLVLWIFLGVMMNNIAVACDSTYDPVSGLATIACMEMPGDARSFDAFLRGAGGDTFVLIGSVNYAVREPGVTDAAGEPRVTSLRILTSAAFPVAVISGIFPDSCWSTYKTPTVTQTGTTIDIRFSARKLNGPDAVCMPTPVAFVQAVPISPAGDPSLQTYIVNRVRMVPTF
jgi:hypothetical protein